MAGEKILVVDDDEDIRNAVKIILELENMDVTTMDNGRDVLSFLSKKPVDIVLLDLVLDDMDGFEILSNIRKSFPKLPVILVSGKDQVHNKVLGLGLGADDYITKPFNEAELIARIKTNIRRAKIYRDNVPYKKILEYENLKLDTEVFKLYIDQNEVQLTNRMFRLMKLFMQQPERVFSKEQIFKNLCDNNQYNDYDENSVMVYISNLRKNIDEIPESRVKIKTIRGIGYMLTAKKNEN